MNKISISSLLLTLTLGGLSAQAAPITVQTENGPLTLPQPAKRVIALEYSYLDTLEALGLTATGAALTTQGGDRGAPAYLKPLVTDVKPVGSRAQPNLETILTLKPDLILADALGQKAALPALGRIAPTAVYQNRRGSYDDVLAQVLDIGKLTGREARARQLLGEQAGLVAKATAFTKKTHRGWWWPWPRRTASPSTPPTPLLAACWANWAAGTSPSRRAATRSTSSAWRGWWPSTPARWWC